MFDDMDHAEQQAMLSDGWRDEYPWDIAYELSEYNQLWEAITEFQYAELEAQQDYAYA